MGRRAKTKQGDPAPLVEVQENAGRPSQKKLGKRKADDGESASKRPAKKVKETSAKPAKAPAAAKGKEKTALKAAKAKADQPTPKKQKRARFDDEDEDEGAGSSEGWEDVEDDGDLKAEAKYVYFSYSSGTLFSNGHGAPGRYSMTVTRASL